MFFAHQMTFQSPTNGDTAPFLSHWNKLIGTAIRHTITVLELPPSESCSSRVSLEFLYGMCWDFPSTKADMTFPRVDNDRLIFVASFNRWPVAPVLDCLSEPYIHTSTATPPRLIRSGEKQHTFAVNAWCQFLIKFSSYHTHTQSFNGTLSGTTQVSRYQKGKTNVGFTEARDSEWQWHQLGHMQVCTSL